jgi:hypothetical protein
VKIGLGGETAGFIPCFPVDAIYCVPTIRERNFFVGTQSRGVGFADFNRTERFDPLSVASTNAKIRRLL